MGEEREGKSFSRWVRECIRPSTAQGQRMEAQQRRLLWNSEEEGEEGEEVALGELGVRKGRREQALRLSTE